MPLTKIWIHLVFSTKNRYPFLAKKEIRQKLLDHIKENSRTKKIFVHAINGYIDHVHLLIRLQPVQSLSKVVQLIKGESSHWANESNIIESHFEWQQEYFAVSVSETNLPKVISYIENQETHHEKASFDDEYTELLKKYGLVEEIQ